MFNNPFLKKDPLVEAVRQAQQEGDLRRQAEAIVNEAFGVYSRKAVIRENLAAYDAALEEAYNNLKEGPVDAGSMEGSKSVTKSAPKEDPSLPKSYPGAATSAPTAQRLSNAKAALKEKWEGSKEDKDEDAKLAKKHGMTMDQWEKSAADKKHDAKEKMDEEEKPNAWGQYPKEAKETRKRLRQDKAAKAYSKMREKMVGKGKDLETTRKIVGEAKKLADKDYDKDGKIESPKDEVWGSRFRAAKAAGKMEEAKGTAAVQNLKHRDFKETRHPNPGAVTKAPVPGVSIAEDQLDEISKGRAISAYRQKEGEDRDTSKLHGLIKRKFGKETAKHAERAGAQDTVGLVRRGEDRGKEDSIARDQRLGSAARKTKGGKIHKQDTATLKGNIKRRLGSHTKPGHLPEEQMDEAAYSAKAARAGKDIGKPGKMFSKIASKAGEKYGSAERGKKVAGAILKRIRAKHMKEDQIDEVVSASALKASGLSLRDYMNKQQGLTRRDGSTPTKSSSTPQGAPGLKGPSGEKFGTTNPSVRWKDPVTAGKTADKPAAVPSTPAPEKSATWHAPMSRPPQEVASKVADVSTGAPKVAQGAPMPTATSTASAAPKSKEAGSIPKTVAESVQVGDYKYRIV